MKDWLKLHRALMDAEAELQRLAEAFAGGRIPEAELNEQQALVVAMRAVADQVFYIAVSTFGDSAD